MFYKSIATIRTSYINDTVVIFWFTICSYDQDDHLFSRMVKQWLACGLILFLSFIVRGQDLNPFEVQSRVGSVDVIDTVNYNDTIVGFPETDSVIRDTIVAADLEKSERSFLDLRQQQVLNDNPFNVTHIPIRKRVEDDAVKRTDDIQENQPVQSVQRKVEDNPPQDGGSIKFLFWFFLIQLLLITSILGINRDFFKKLNRSISNDNFAKLIGRDYNNGFDALFLITYVIFIFSLSIFIFLMIRQFYGISGFWKYIVILGSVVAVYLFRHIFLSFLGFVFPFKKTLSYYNFMIILFNCYLGLLLLPVNILLAYAPLPIAHGVVYVGIAFIIITYLLRLLRGSLHAYTLVRNNVFHFFLYLCACEIAPILILVRFLGNSFSI